MRNRLSGVLILVGVLATGVLLVPSSADAQAADLQETSDGHPDIQGYWRYIRPPETFEFYTLEGLAELYEGSGEPIRIGVAGRPAPGPHKSVVIDPPDGRIPYQPWALAEREASRVVRVNPTRPEHIDGRSWCFPAGVPRQTYEAMGGGLHQVLQTPGYVVMVWDFAHSYRIIPIDGRPHVGSKLTLWQGDSRGRWEGNTLVVDTTNQHGKSLDMMGDFHGDGLHVVERFEVVDADTIHYEATLDDPGVYTRPWTMALKLTRDRDVEDIWEFACHEGNRLEVPGMP